MTNEGYIVASLVISFAVGGVMARVGYNLGHRHGMNVAYRRARTFTSRLNNGHWKSQAEINFYEGACAVEDEILREAAR